jgi:DNA polymerase-3 subunit beta
MKFIVSQSDLLVAVTAVSQAIPNRPTHPVLGCIHVVADAESVTFRGFDLKMGIEFTIPASTEIEGVIVIPNAKSFKEIISKLDDGEITIDNHDELKLDSEESAIKLTSISGVYEFQTMPVDDYPEIPTPENEPIELYAQPLKAGFDSVMYASSSEETKQVLTGINIKTQAGFIYFASTDGHRLATAVIANDLGELPQVTIPKYAIASMLKMMPMNYETDVIHVSCDHNGIEFKAGNIRIYSRVLEGAYPQYEQLIPDQFQGVVTFNRTALLKALDRISVVASTRNMIVVCTVGMLGIATISSESDGSKGQEQLTVQPTQGLFKGESEYAIAFNIKYLVEALKSFNCVEITLKLNSPTQPVILKHTDSAITQTGLLMPVQLRD